MVYSILVSDFVGSSTIKIPCSIVPASKSIRATRGLSAIIDTGADTSAISKQALVEHGYGKYTTTSKWTTTANGKVQLKTCALSGITVARQFSFPALTVGVMENWDNMTVIGVIGMDIISRMTFILSHEYKKFMLTNKSVPVMSTIFGGNIK